MFSKPLSDVGMETIVLAESANIRLQNNSISQNIILSFLITKQNRKPTEMSFRLLVKPLWQHLWRFARKFGYPNMNLRRQRTLYISICKTLNKLNPGYKNDIFKLRNTDRLAWEKDKLNLEIPKSSPSTFGTRGLKAYGPKVWNA